MPAAGTPASGDRRGSARVGAGRCAREGGSKHGLAWPQSPPPLRAELSSPPSLRLPRPAAARPARVPAPRRAAPRPLGRFHGPRRDGVAMETGRRQGGGSAREEATVTCAGSPARCRHSGGHLGYTDPHSGPELQQLRDWLGTGVRGQLATRVRRPGSRSLASRALLSTPKPIRPLGVRPGLDPSSAPGTQGHLFQPSWAEMALYTLLEG